MTTLREQLKDDIYRKWFLKVPTIRVQGTDPPWRVFVIRDPDSNLARVDFYDYVQAFSFLKKHLREYHDMALHSKRQMFGPPVVGRRDGVKSHRRLCFPPFDAEGIRRPGWCPHCRRMVSFSFYPGGRHPNMGIVSPGEPRCTFCGMRQHSIPAKWRL